jgi:hypothetical protein
VQDLLRLVVCLGGPGGEDIQRSAKVLEDGLDRAYLNDTVQIAGRIVSNYREGGAASTTH